MILCRIAYPISLGPEEPDDSSVYSLPATFITPASRNLKNRFERRRIVFEFGVQSLSVRNISESPVFLNHQYSDYLFVKKWDTKNRPLCPIDAHIQTTAAADAFITDHRDRKAQRPISESDILTDIAGIAARAHSRTNNPADIIHRITSRDVVQRHSTFTRGFRAKYTSQV